MRALEDTATARKIKSPFYGWWVVTSGGAVQWYTSAVFWRGFSVFFVAILDTFGWPRSATAAAVSIQRMESGMFSPFVGTIIDRFGPRRVMLFGVVVTGISFLLLSRIQTLWQFYLVIVLMTVGMSFGTFIVLVTTVGNWFIRRRARAISILMSASAVGGLTLPLLQGSIDSFGWRDVMFAVGIGFFVIGIPAALAMRTRPEDYGQLPDGMTAEEAHAAAASARHVAGTTRHEVAIDARSALKLRFFWQLAIATSLGQFVSATNLLHVDALEVMGLGTLFAATAVGFVAIGDFVGRISISVLGDRFNKRKLIGAAFAVQSLGVLGLAAVNMNIGSVSLGVAPLFLYVATFGLGFGASIPLRLSILADYFGRRSYGSIVGLTSSVNALFGAAGAALVAGVVDLTGDYRTPFFVLAVLLATAVPMTLTLENQSRVAAQARRALRKTRVLPGA